MKLTTVLCSVNNNPNYYRSIPKQILFWDKFNIKFITIFAGESIPDELQEYSDNIILWNKNLDLHSAFISQNIRIYYPALLNLPDDEMVLISDIDNLPINEQYFKNDLDKCNIDDFVHYYEQMGNHIYMDYNAAHPKTWGKIFHIKTENDIEKKLYETYNINYNGIPGTAEWWIDQEVLTSHLLKYPHLKFFHRSIRTIHVHQYNNHIENKDENFLSNYDDLSFARNYNEEFALNIQKLLFNI